MNLEYERKKLEFKRVEMAKLEMEFKIKQRLEEIEKLKESIDIQESRLIELKKEIGE